MDGGEREVECGIGTIATVCYGEVAGMPEGLANTKGQEEGTHLGELQSSHSGCEESGQDGKIEISTPA